MPVFDTANNVNASGEIVKGDDGAVYYNPVPANDKMYVFGSSRVNWIDWLGALLFAGTLLGVVGHGTLRYLVDAEAAQGSGKDRADLHVRVLSPLLALAADHHPSSSCCSPA